MGTTAQGSCCCSEEAACTSVITQCADVSIPIKLTPHAVVGHPETFCCGEAIVTVQTSQGRCGCDCQITITQPVCIRIPVTFITGAESGDTCVSYKKSAGAPPQCCPQQLRHP